MATSKKSLSSSPTSVESSADLSQSAPQNYELAFEELQDLIARMESGQLPLEALLVNYQRGAQLLQYCRQRLQAVESQIKVLAEGGLKDLTI